MGSCRVNKGDVKAHCRDAGTRKHDPLSQSFKYRLVELLVERSTSRPKHFVDDLLGRKKEISMLLIVDMLIFDFLACVSLECDITGSSVSFRGRTETTSLVTRGSFSIHSQKSRHSVIFNCDRTGQ
ncbi:hypothetical protein AVEN_234177-1 [Araneus ventricosus]|uniref:Uncharacterized protein n=1 Tax=Araneus ventricosus TaxID=182803 RepID=A0A4Y2L413_ARAVE|nr:hypothetical protein AVEN_234177-1 [Araneus ventricosus]